MTALAGAVRRGAMGRLTVERADGEPILGSTEPLREALAGPGSWRHRGGCGSVAESRA